MKSTAQDKAHLPFVDRNIYSVELFGWKMRKQWNISTVVSWHRAVPFNTFVQHCTAEATCRMAATYLHWRESRLRQLFVVLSISAFAIQTTLNIVTYSHARWHRNLYNVHIEPGWMKAESHRDSVLLRTKLNTTYQKRTQSNEIIRNINDVQKSVKCPYVWLKWVWLYCMENLPKCTSKPFTMNPSMLHVSCRGSASGNFRQQRDYHS